MRQARALEIVAALLSALMLSCSSQTRLFDQSARAEVRATTPPGDTAYLVDTGARLILPRADVDILRYLGEEKVFVQFERPLRAAERAELEAAGVVFHETFAPFTYLASVPESAAPALANQPLFRGLEPMSPTDKVTAAIFLDAVPSHAERPDGAVAVLFRFYRDVSLEDALALLDGMGIRVTERGRFHFGQQLEGISRRDQILATARSPLVRAIFEVPPPAEVDD